MDAREPLFIYAEKLASRAESLGVPLLIIGAAALAGHRYVRMTRDLDLAGNVPLSLMRELAEACKADGVEAELRLPDADDPLGGVLDLQGPFGQIQVISFADRFPAVIRDALEDQPLAVRDNASLKIIPLPHLVVLKLYAGGLKSKADILEVLIRNPEADLNGIEALCNRYRLHGFDEIRRELGH